MTDKKSIILCIESSGSFCSVALASGNKVMDIITETETNVHDERLAYNVRRILDRNRLDMSSLGAVAVSSGPGSFTGLRIGGALAKALTFGDDIRLIALPTFDALALYYKNHINPGVKGFYVITRSHADNYYYKLFDSDGKPVGTELMKTSAELERETGIPGFGIGDMNLPSLTKADGITADMLVNLAAEKFNNGDFITSAEYVPLYVQEFRINRKTE